MTKPSEVTVSDAEVQRAFEAIVYAKHADDVRQALAAFLAARVPDAKEVDFHKPGMAPLLKGGEWNACRDKVLKGV